MGFPRDYYVIYVLGINKDIRNTWGVINIKNEKTSTRKGYIPILF